MGIDASNKEDVSLENEPRGTESGKILDGNPLLVVIIVPLLSSSSGMPSIVLYGLGSGSQDPSSLASQDLSPDPVENFSVESVAACNGD